MVPWFSTLPVCTSLRIPGSPDNPRVRFNLSHLFKDVAFCFFAARFSFRVRIELALVGAERPQPGAPTCGSRGPARPARCRHSHTRGHTVCISKISTEPDGPEIPPRRSGPARCPHSDTRASIPRLWEKPPGLGRRGPGSVSKPVLETPALGLLASASPPAATEEIFAGNSCCGCGGLGSVFQARGGAIVARTATPAPPGSPARVQAFPAQIHSRVRPKQGLPRSKVI